MSSYGFVYMLVNDYMTCFKIGCTERSPHLRAEELSGSTGVPLPFRVACYIETPSFQTVERHIHEWLDSYRVSRSREFFKDAGKAGAFRLLRWYPHRLAFVLVDELEWYGAEDRRPDELRFDLDDQRSSPYGRQATQSEPEEPSDATADSRADEPAPQARDGAE